MIDDTNPLYKRLRLHAGNDAADDFKTAMAEAKTLHDNATINDQQYQKLKNTITIKALGILMDAVFKR